MPPAPKEVFRYRYVTPRTSRIDDHELQYPPQPQLPIQMLRSAGLRGCPALQDAQIACVAQGAVRPSNVTTKLRQSHMYENDVWRNRTRLEHDSPD